MQHAITAVVPTYNRPKQLSRLLAVLKSVDSRVRLLVLDGSQDANAVLNEKLSRDFEHVEYRRFPSDLHLGLRLTEGLKLVKTPYMLFCADDDFFFPGAAAECAAFLDGHPDYSAALGRVWALRYFPQVPLVRGGIALGDDLDHGRQFSHVRFIQRALYYFAYTAIGSLPLFYAVRRTASALEAFSMVTASMKYSSMELLTNGMLLAEGRIARLPVAFGLRDYASETTRDPEREGAASYIPAEDLAAMRPLLVAALARSERHPEEVAAYLVDSLLSMWGSEAVTVPHEPEPGTRIFLRKVGFCIECLLGRLSPSRVAGYRGVPAATYRSLLAAHQAHTARR
jgi:glycosyltransferase domain-containing protein